MTTAKPIPVPAEARIVLVVEDEPVLRSYVVRSLSKLPSIEVEGVGTIREARQLIAAEAPDLILLDLDLPDGNGIDLATELRRQGSRAQIIFVTGVAREFHDRLRGVELLEKPVPTERLRKIVQERLGEGFQSGPSPFSVADYLQLASMSRRSAALELTSSLGNKGVILLREGELWSAMDSQGTGMDAFRRLALLQNAQVQCRAMRPDEFGPQTLTGSAMGVLLDVARESDEDEHRHSGVFEALDERAFEEREVLAPFAELQPEPAKPDFDELYEQGVDAVLAKDYRKAWDIFSAAAELRPDDPRVEGNLLRLRALGHSH